MVTFGRVVRAMRGQVVATSNSSPLDVRRQSVLPAKWRSFSIAADTCWVCRNPALRASASMPSGVKKLRNGVPAARAGKIPW